MRTLTYFVGFGLAMLMSSAIFAADAEFPKKMPKVTRPPTVPSRVQGEGYKSELERIIGNTEEECLDKNQSQMGMDYCYEDTEKAWDKSLNEVYKQLYNRIDKNAKVVLKNAQREWITYRDSHYKFLDAYYAKFEGSMYGGLHTRDRYYVVRDRTLELNSLLELTELRDAK